MIIQGMAFMNAIQLWAHKRHEQKRKVNYFVTISQSNWRNIKKINDDEIEINGDRFDVKFIELKNHKLTLYGHYDKEENDIVKQHSDFNKKKQEQKHTPSFTFLFYEKIENPMINPLKNWISKTENHYTENLLKGKLNGIFIPPKTLI
jgi:hypothetical protein